jgi:RHS repeat-associated protein
MVFTGQEHDENTGLIYFGARYYDPDSARFISQDSYLGEAGTPPSLHRYLYAYGNPTVWVDLMGYASVNYLPGRDENYRNSGWDGSSNLLEMKFDGVKDGLSGLMEVGDDGRKVLSTSLDYADYTAAHLRVLAFSPVELLIGDRNAKISVENPTGAQEGDVFVLAVNGLNNTMADYQDDLQSLSVGMPIDEYMDMINRGKKPATKPYPIHYVYNDSYVNMGSLANSKYRRLGVALDGTQALTELGGTGMIDSTSRKIGESINEAIEGGNYSRVVLAVHSHGGIKSSAGMSLVNPQYRDKVTVINYGSAHIKPYFGAEKTINVHREQDVITNGPGLRPIRQGLLDNIFNLLGSTNASTVIAPAGAVKQSDRMLFGIPYTHGNEQKNLSGNNIGYNATVPAILHKEIYR